MRRILWAVFAALAALTPASADEPARWSEGKAQNWYAAQPWLLGSNYLPSNAINELEMWQAASFDPARIDLELGWAEKLGMNTMRVFLHDQLWQKDAKGFAARIDTFLTIAAKHHIKPVFVLFDSCWDPDPVLGPQHPPIPGIHNSGWVQSPGRDGLDDPSRLPQFQAYVKGIVGRFAKDPRILAWDVWNEPDNEGGGNYQARQSKHKFDRVADLLPKVFAWARSENPAQPLTSGVWHNPSWDKTAGLNKIEQIQLTQSDIITFHDYGWPETFAGRISELKSYNRPIICTEYMARGNGSTFDGDLPIAKRANVGMINWGFVNGRSQTHLPWDSWKRPYVDLEPQVWFHDILYPDGTPYRPAETELLKAFSAAPKGVIPATAP